MSFFNQGRRTALTFLGSPAKNLSQLPNTFGFLLSPPPHAIPFFRQFPSLRLFSLPLHRRDWLKRARENFVGPASSSPTTYIRKPYANEPPSNPDLLPPPQTTSHPPLSPSSHHLFKIDMLSSMRPPTLDPFSDPTNRWCCYDTPPPSDKKTFQQDGRRDGSRQGVCSSLWNVATKDEWRC